jgi:hypothetical protein
MVVECVSYPCLQGDVPIPRRPRNNVTREPCGGKCVNRLLCPETSRLHPLLDSVLLLGLFTVGATRALAVRVMPLAQPKIHSARCIRCNKSRKRKSSARAHRALKAHTSTHTAHRALRRPFDKFEFQDKGTVRADPGLITRIIPFEGFTGRYVWHCHILEHEDNEMMRPFEVVSSGA